MKLDQNNSKATNALLNGLGESVFTKVAILNPLKIFGTNFEVFMEIQNSKQKSFKLTEVSSNN
jgi:hypothetical protein